MGPSLCEVDELGLNSFIYNALFPCGPVLPDTFHKPKTEGCSPSDSYGQSVSTRLGQPVRELARDRFVGRGLAYLKVVRGAGRMVRAAQPATPSRVGGPTAHIRVVGVQSP